LLVLPDARVLSRELLYTALTRARRSVWLWGAAETVDRALARSGLEARLRRLSASGECAVP
jgi:exodeoxyribonuclease V alpha subunit